MLGGQVTLGLKKVTLVWRTTHVGDVRIDFIVVTLTIGTLVLDTPPSCFRYFITKATPRQDSGDHQLRISRKVGLHNI